MAVVAAAAAAVPTSIPKEQKAVNSSPQKETGGKRREEFAMPPTTGVENKSAREHVKTKSAEKDLILIAFIVKEAARRGTSKGRN